MPLPRNGIVLGARYKSHSNFMVNSLNPGSQASSVVRTTAKFTNEKRFDGGGGGGGGGMGNVHKTHDYTIGNAYRLKSLKTETKNPKREKKKKTWRTHNKHNVLTVNLQQLQQAR